MSKDRSPRPSDSTTIGISRPIRTSFANVQPVELRIRIRNRTVAQKEGEEVMREIVFPRRREEVWEALTEPGAARGVVRHRGRARRAARRRAAFRWGNGEERHAMVEEVDRGAAARLDWDDGGRSCSRSRTVPDGTRLRVAERRGRVRDGARAGRRSRASRLSRGRARSRRARGPSGGVGRRDAATRGSATPTELGARAAGDAAGGREHLAALQDAGLVEVQPRRPRDALPR